MADDATVLVYLGSLGAVYMLDEMLRFFGRLRRARPDARFLFIGHHDAGELGARARSLGVDAGPESFLVQAAEHAEVPG